MLPRVVNTWVYPIKGMHGIDIWSRDKGIIVSPEQGVIGDRTFAISRTIDVPTEWQKKGKFLVAANTPGIAIDHGLTQSDLIDGDRLTVHAVRWLARERGVDLKAHGLLDTENKRHNADNNKPYVSFLNLNSVRELSKYVGRPVDPRRFRMNVWVEGLPAFFELEYITSYEQPNEHPMSIGEIKFGCDDVCERCKAIEQNPQTGEFDTELNKALIALLKERGYAGSPHRGTHNVMGWYAIPQKRGVVRSGDQIEFPK